MTLTRVSPLATSAHERPSSTQVDVDSFKMAKEDDLERYVETHPVDRFAVHVAMVTDLLLIGCDVFLAESHAMSISLPKAFNRGAVGSPVPAAARDTQVVLRIG